MALRIEHLLASFANQLNAGSIFGRRAGGYAPNITTKQRNVMSTTNVWVVSTIESRPVKPATAPALLRDKPIGPE